MTVSVFLSTLQLTALLLKSFRLRLHCYTLQCVGRASCCGGKTPQKKSAMLYAHVKLKGRVYRPVESGALKNKWK